MMESPPTPPSTEPVPPPLRKPWPDVPKNHALAAWCLVMQDRMEELHEDVRDLKRRPPTFTQQAMGLAKTSLGKDGRNVPFFIVGMIALVAILWSQRDFLLSGFGVSLSTGAEAHTLRDRTGPSVPAPGEPTDQ